MIEPLFMRYHGTQATANRKNKMDEKEIQLCTPDGIRVWRGFRSRRFFDNRAGFNSKIGGIFVPQTAQQMEPLGLRAYFPALLPDSLLPGNKNRLLKIPDEVALVIYPSRASYNEAVKHSVTGRAYGLLHSSVFNFNDPKIPPSQSGYPEPWSGELHWDTPCHLASNAIDWRSGVTHLLAARPDHNMTAENFLEQLNNIIHGWMLKAEKKVNGSIICASSEYLLYWEHSDTGTKEGSLLPLLQKILETPYLNSAARSVIVPPAFYQPDEGVDISAGDFLDVRVDTYR